jgi:hypothetical protein
MSSSPRKSPEDFVEALISDDEFRQRVEADPEHVIRTELDHPHVDTLPSEVFPQKGITLPAPDRLRPVVDTLKEHQFFPGHGHDLAAVLTCVQPAFPFVAVGDGAD